MWRRLDKDRWRAEPQADGSRNLLLRRGERLAELHWDTYFAFVHLYDGEPGENDSWPLGEPGEAPIVKHVDSQERTDLEGADEEQAWAALLEVLS
jgi:hypothetical protein